MDIKISVDRIVSLEELRTETPEVKRRLDNGEILVVFENNRPQFLAVGLQYQGEIEPLECIRAEPAGLVGEQTQPERERIAQTGTEGTSQGETLNFSGLKIGELVRQELERLIAQDALTEQDIRNLTNQDYCEQVFHNRRPILVEVDHSRSPVKQRQDARGYSRFYSQSYKIRGKEYFLTNCWVESSHRAPFIRWLDDRRK